MQNSNSLNESKIDIEAKATTTSVKDWPYVEHVQVIKYELQKHLVLPDLVTEIVMPLLNNEFAIFDRDF
jgi:hypothetical protein